jgi:hypothetical protein
MVVLRELAEADVIALHQLYGSAEATRHLSFEPRTTEQVEQIIVEACRGSHSGTASIEAPHDHGADDRVGICSACNQPDDPSHYCEVVQDVQRAPGDPLAAADELPSTGADGVQPSYRLANRLPVLAFRIAIEGIQGDGEHEAPVLQSQILKPSA